MVYLKFLNLETTDGVSEVVMETVWLLSRDLSAGLDVHTCSLVNLALIAAAL